MLCTLSVKSLHSRHTLTLITSLGCREIESILFTQSSKRTVLLSDFSDSLFPAESEAQRSWTASLHDLKSGIFIPLIKQVLVEKSKSQLFLGYPSTSDPNKTGQFSSVTYAKTFRSMDAVLKQKRV